VSEPEHGTSPGSTGLPRSVRLVSAVGFVLFWTVQLGLLSVMDLALLDSVLVAALLVAVPALSLAQLPIIGDAEIERLPAYWSSVATLWLLGTACWFVGSREGGGAALGFTSVPVVVMASWTVALTLGGLLTIFVFREISVRLGFGDSRLIRELMPRTPRERSAFVVLSLAAGFGEEIAYRGYAITVLAPGLGVPGAALLTSAVFGVLHGYQGAFGILRAGAIGGLLAWGFLASGSLWPAIAAHTAIDLLAGLWLGDRLLSPEASSGVGGDAGGAPTES
jgi:membrane protease YdiL (CAAX protease family)